MKSTRQAKRDAKRIFRLCLTGGVLDEDRARAQVRYVVASGHRDVTGILTEFLRLLAADEERRKAMIDCAAPLSREVQLEIEAGLAKRYGEGLTAVFREAPELIGGVRIRVGSDLYDASVLGSIAQMARSF